jgi:hypothetical protein
MKRHWHVASIFTLALIARIILFDQVGVWGDFGFYTYDSRLILEGQTPFVDFLGRSPVFLYAFAAVRAIIGHPVALLRIFITVLWFGCGLIVYDLGRQIQSHWVGVVSLAVFLLSPFALTYHYWANTQSMAALFSIAAVWVILREDSTRVHAVAGVLLGVSFLARRSTIVIAAAIGVWYLIHSQRRTDSVRAFARGSSVMAGTITATSLVTLLAVYAAIVGGSTTQTLELFTTHAVNLVLSVGRGGYPLLGETAPPVTNTLDSGRIPIFNDICQLCGIWTARTFAKTLLVSLPLVAPLLIWFRDTTDRGLPENTQIYVAGSLGTLAAYAIIRVIIAGYWTRAAGITALVLFAIIIYYDDIPSHDQLYTPPIQLLLLILAFLSVGYLYRNRFLHTYYFADFVPYLSLLAGIAYVELWDRRTTLMRATLTTAIILAVIASTLGAHPLTVVALNNNQAGWFTMSNIPEYQEDLDERVNDSRVIWTGHPTYVAGSDAKLVGNVSRSHYLAATFRNDTGVIGPAADYYATHLIPGLRSGHIQFVIMEKMSHRMLRYNDTAREAFEANYCRVDSADQLYDRTNATLYRYQPDCITSKTPTVSQNYTNK